MNTRKAIIVADLGFGDAGKGSIIDFLSRAKDVAAVVRYNGGAQAAHNVVTPDGRHHTFAQFGSGTFVPGVRTHLSRFMLIDLPAMEREAAHLVSLGLGDPFGRLSVDAEALVVTPFQKAGNRLREVLRGDARHGSCGMGVGETTHDAAKFPSLVVRVRDLRDSETLLRKLKELQELKQVEFKSTASFLWEHPYAKKEMMVLSEPSAPAYFAEQFRKVAMRFRIVSRTHLGKLAGEGSLIFEGAQGVLLDRWHGFHPYTTQSATTPVNALELLREVNYGDAIEKLGVLRAYFTRHGPGPFPTEDQMLSLTIPDVHNGVGIWQGGFRIGWFDAVLARYAVEVSGGVDALAITNVDRWNVLGERKIAVAYDIAEGALGKKEREAVLFEKMDASHTTRAISFRPKSVLTDLGYQEILTRLLEHSTPVYQSTSANSAEYMRDIAELVGVPISIVSSGQTAVHKKFVDRAERKCGAR